MSYSLFLCLFGAKNNNMLSIISPLLETNTTRKHRLSTPMSTALVPKEAYLILKGDNPDYIVGKNTKTMHKTSVCQGQLPDHPPPNQTNLIQNYRCDGVNQCVQTKPKGSLPNSGLQAATDGGVFIHWKPVDPESPFYAVTPRKPWMWPEHIALPALPTSTATGENLNNFT